MGLVEHVVAGGVLYLLQLEVGLVEHVVESGHPVLHLAAQTVVFLCHEVLQLLFTLFPAKQQSRLLTKPMLC